MLEDSVGTLGKIIISVTIIVFFLNLFTTFVVLDNANELKIYANYQIEKKGGLTKETQAEINKYAEDNFSRKISVEGQDLGAKPYGEAVDYKITVDSLNPFLNRIELKGSAVALAKGG